MKLIEKIGSNPMTKERFMTLKHSNPFVIFFETQWKLKLFLKHFFLDILEAKSSF